MLVSALMSTRNRRPFVARAIRCFQAQTWPDRELVICDDGDDAVGDLVPADPRIRYVRVAHVGRLSGGAEGSGSGSGSGARPSGDGLALASGVRQRPEAEEDRPSRTVRPHMIPLNLREKRQATFDAASPDAGAYMIWDDDDWHGPERMARQVAQLQIRGGACLLDPIVFHEVGRGRSWRWSARGRYQMCVGTLAFTRAYYDLVPGGFPARRETHSDQQFVRDRPWADVSYVGGEDVYIAVRHGGNSSDCTIVPGGAWMETQSVADRLSD